MNLRRFTTAKIKINHVSKLGEVTKYHENKSADKDPLINSNNPKIQFYLKLDQVLVGELLGKTVTFKQIVQTIKHRYPEVYKEVIQRSIDLCNVLV